MPDGLKWIVRRRKGFGIMDMKLLHQKFCRESFNEDGVIQHFEPVYDEHFNFAYDVIDEIARNEP